MLRELYDTASPLWVQRPQRATSYPPGQQLRRDSDLLTNASAAEMQHRIQAVFELFDTDGSGTVDEEELEAAMLALGLSFEGSRSSDARVLLNAVDADRSQSVDLAEFSALMQVAPRSVRLNDLAAC
jgi:Ca2+-binding EF-hand superfamily protein